MLLMIYISVNNKYCLHLTWYLPFLFAIHTFDIIRLTFELTFNKKTKEMAHNMLNQKRINLVVDETLRLEIIIKPSFIDLGFAKNMLIMFLKTLKKHIILKLILYVFLMYCKKKEKSHNTDGLCP